LPAYPYTPVTGKLKTLLHKVRTTGIPPKLSTAHLKTLGFTSSNDPSMIGVLRFIGFVDSSNIPTPLWSEYRGQNHRAVLGKAVKQGYADLFALYPEANTASVADLTHVFSTSSTGGELVIKQTVQSFKTLVEEADFSADDSIGASVLSTGPLHLDLCIRRPHHRWHPCCQREVQGHRHHIQPSTSTSKSTSPQNHLRSRSTRSLKVWRSTCTDQRLHHDFSAEYLRSGSSDQCRR
jgi:hypothetical protein